MNIITLKIRKQNPRVFPFFSQFFQVYNLLPVKKDFNVQYDGFMNEDIEGCIIAEDIIHNGIIYTPKQILDDGDVYSIFEVILPKNITRIDL